MAAHLWTSAAATAAVALAGRGAAALALLGSHWGRAADAVARAAHLQPRAKVGGGGSAALAGISVDVCGGNGAGRGGRAALALLGLCQGQAADAQALGLAAGQYLRRCNASDPSHANLTGEHASSWSNTVQLHRS